MIIRSHEVLKNRCLDQKDSFLAVVLCAGSVELLPGRATEAVSGLSLLIAHARSIRSDWSTRHTCRNKGRWPYSTTLFPGSVGFTAFPKC